MIGNVNVPGALAADMAVINNAMVRVDSPDTDGFSQLYKMENGQRVDINPKTSNTNELTDETFVAKMNEQIDALEDIAVKLGYNPWLTIQKMVRNGTFADHYAVGDQFTIKYNGNDMLWDIVAIDVATPADTSLTHSVTLMSHDCLEEGFMMIDNAEPDNPDTNRQKHGNNRYAHSTIRQWLNSSADAGNWWFPQHEYDTVPNYATAIDGFMKGIDSEFLTIIGKTKIVVAKNTVTDGGGSETLSDEYFYLPSVTELGYANENNIAEGALFPYFNSGAKRIKKYNGSYEDWWLRTPKSNSSSEVRVVWDTSTLNSNNANYTKCVAPVCNII